MRISVVLQILFAIVVFGALAANARRAPVPSIKPRVDWGTARAVVATNLVAPLRERSNAPPRYELFSRAGPRWQSDESTIAGYELVALGDELRGELTLRDRAGGSATYGFRIDLAGGDVLVTDGGVEHPAAEWLRLR